MATQLDWYASLRVGGRAPVLVFSPAVNVAVYGPVSFTRFQLSNSAFLHERYASDS